MKVDHSAFASQGSISETMSGLVWLRSMDYFETKMLVRES